MTLQVTSAPEYFVAPPLNSEESFASAGPGPQTPRAILIGAAAAMGKSVFAEAIAGATGNPLWCMANLRVGDGSFLGLFNSFARGADRRRVEELHEAGDLCLILDALDETALGSGPESFERFLTGMAEEIGNLTAPRPIVVLLGRPETMDDVQIVFQEHAVPYEYYKLDYFDRNAAGLFIDHWMDAFASEDVRNPSEAPHVRNRAKFVEVRDALFGEMWRALSVPPGEAWDRPDVLRFAGYAPVLRTLAEYLYADGTPNYASMLHEVDRLGSGSAWGFLVRICDGILRREAAEKVLPQVEDLLVGAESSVVNSVYSSDEQCRMLLRPVVEPRAPKGLAGDAASALVKRISAFASQHPFLSEGGNARAALRDRFGNVVVRDYLFAWALMRGDEAAVARVVQTSQHERYLPTPILAHFVTELAPTPIPEVDASAFWLVYLSHRAAGSTQLTIRDGETAADSEDEATVTLTVGDELSAFRITGLRRQPLVFARELDRATVDLAGASVQLGDGMAIRIGPDVDVKAETLLIDSPEIVVHARSGDSEPTLGVLLQATNLDDRSRSSRPVAGSLSELSIAVPHLEYPWYEYKQRIPDHVDPRAAEACLDLWQLMKWFRGGVGAPGLHYMKEPLETAISKHKTSAAIYEYALKVELIREEGKLLRLNPARLGAPIEDVRQRRIEGALERFLMEYLSWLDDRG